MSELELARALFGGSRAEETTGATGKTTTIFGTATADSSSGSVTVIPDGDSATEDDGVEVELPTYGTIKEGDRVSVTVVDGSPTVTGVVGGGDRQQSLIDTAQATADTANGTANTLATLIRDSDAGTLVTKVGQSIGALVNANGSFDIVALTWSDSTPTIGATIATFNGTSISLGAAGSSINLGTWASSPSVGDTATIHMYGNSASLQLTIGGTRDALRIGAGDIELACQGLTLSAVHLYASSTVVDDIKSMLGLVTTTLYSNSSGSTDTITLSSSLANFVRVKIVYGNNNLDEMQVREIMSPNGKTTSLYSMEAADATNTFLRRTKYTLSGTTITPAYGGYFKVGPNGFAATVSGNYIKIVAVYGYQIL